MTAGAPLPLLVRRPLWPDESLYSYLIRLANLNCYPVGDLLALGLAYETDTGLRLDNAFYPKQPQTYARLAGLTRQSSAALYRATPHRYARLLALSRPVVKTIAIPGTGTQPVLTDQRPYTLRGERQAQFCPQCLQEAAYHRLIWTPVFVLVCLRHECLLANRCPGCGREVHLAEVVQTQCRRCRVNLRQTPLQSVRGDEFGLFVQRMLQSWLEGQPLAPGGWADLLPPQPPAALYYCAMRLLMSLLEAMDPSVNWKTPQMCARLSPEVVYAFWTRACRALVGWPEGLYEFVESQTMEALLRDCGPAVADLNGPVRFRRTLLSGGNLAFARLPAAEANPDRRWWQRGRDRPGPTTQAIAQRLAFFPHMTLRAAARTLGVPQIVIQRLIITGRLRGNWEQGDVLRADVLKLAPRWQQPMTVREAAALMGLTPSLVQDLVEHQLIERWQPPAPQARGTRTTCPNATGRLPPTCPNAQGALGCGFAGVKDARVGQGVAHARHDAARLARDSVCEFMLRMAERLRSWPRWSGPKVKTGLEDETVGLTDSMALAAPFGFTAADLFVLVCKGRLPPCRQASPPDLGAIRFPRQQLLWSLRWLRHKQWRG